MKNPTESLARHDHSKNMKTLIRKSAELKDRSRILNQQLESTLKRCDQFLHPDHENNGSNNKAK